MVDVRCKVCDAGTLLRRKKFRMSGPVVAIGYILLIPSILGILASVFIVVALHRTDGFGEGVALFFGVASFVSGLIGWLLVMKKQVLECNACQAVVNAS